MHAVAEPDRMSPDARAVQGQEPLTLLDQLLFEQQKLTAVARFVQRHDADELPLQARPTRLMMNSVNIATA